MRSRNLVQERRRPVRRLPRFAALALSALCVGMGPLLPLPEALGPAAHAQELPAAPSTPGWVEGSLRPGDAVRLYFSRETELSGEFEVDDRGALVLPILGRIDVRELTAEELKSELEDRFEGQLRNQSVQATPLRRVRVLGAVHRPGLYMADPTMAMSDLIALAGGVTDRGQPTRIRLLRGEHEIEVALEAGAPAYSVRSGDQLLVPERSWVSRNSAVLAGALISAVGFLIGQAVF